MKEFYKRIKGGLWVALGGFIVAVVGVSLENLGAFNLSDTQSMVVMILGTAIVTQITKYLNK